jgi:hypothetical protein
MLQAVRCKSVSGARSLAAWLTQETPARSACHRVRNVVFVANASVDLQDTLKIRAVILWRTNLYLSTFLNELLPPDNITNRMSVDNCHE